MPWKWKALLQPMDLVWAEMRLKPSSCSLLLSQLGLAQRGSVSPVLCRQGPSAQRPFCDTAGTDRTPFVTRLPPWWWGLWLPGLMPELEWMWAWAEFQVCNSSLCYGFRQLILSVVLDLQKAEIIVYVDRELGALWVYKQKQRRLG